MNAFKGLLQKDIKLSKTFFYTFLIMMAIAIATGLGFSGYYKSYDLVAAISFGLVAAHFIYLPISIFSSLKLEGKTQLWLHNPNSSIKLLFSKILSSLIFSSISLVISIFLANICLNMSEKMDVFFTSADLLYMGIFALIISSYISIWIIFYWVVYHSLARITWIKKIRWLVLIIIWNAWSAFTYFIDKLPFIMALKQMSIIKLGKAFQFQAGENSFSAGIESTEVSLVVVVGYFGIMVVLFLVSSWLLDRKVEV
ncbi:hypothetical protein [Niallia sp. 03133]|uniref:hypothetical protein n=1 Tax=Niallia sp. 03133 TaxID=3458060 RepID=UPI004044604A